jgi:hypothetical protein
MRCLSSKQAVREFAHGLPDPRKVHTQESAIKRAASKSDASTAPSDSSSDNEELPIHS